MGMTIEQARKIERKFNRTAIPTEEDIFMYTEAMEYLIHEQNNPRDMLQLGGWYYEQKNFDLALKYYTMASAFDIDAADVCLGYIWYYGRTGQRDYEKAFHYYSKSMKRGNLVSTYKVADMYKNGYYVQKDYEKYKEIIGGLYPKVRNARNLNAPLPEVYTRLAGIRKDEGKLEDAVSLYLDAKDFLAQRISYSAFFGNLSIMKWLIDDLYEIIPFDPEDFDFYDLYYVLKQPASVAFYHEGKQQQLESVQEDGTLVIHFNDRWYRTRDDFFQKAVIGDEKLTAVYDDLYGFEVRFTDGTDQGQE